MLLEVWVYNINQYFILGLITYLVFVFVENVKLVL